MSGEVANIKDRDSVEKIMQENEGKSITFIANNIFNVETSTLVYYLDKYSLEYTKAKPGKRSTYKNEEERNLAKSISKKEYENRKKQIKGVTQIIWGPVTKEYKDALIEKASDEGYKSINEFLSSKFEEMYGWKNNANWKTTDSRKKYESKAGLVQELIQ